MSGNEAWNRNVFRRRRKVDRDGADVTLSGRLFQMVGPSTGKARPPTVDSFTDGTSRRLVRAERPYWSQYAFISGCSVVPSPCPWNAGGPEGLKFELRGSCG